MAKAKTKKTTAVRAQKVQQKAHMITWVVFLALIIGLVGGFMIAKEKYMHKIGLISVMFSQRDSELNEMKYKMGKMNKVMVEQGEVWVIKDGTVMVLEEELTLPNGTKIMPNGRYEKDGTVKVLEEGQALDLEGNFVPQGEKVEF